MEKLTLPKPETINKDEVMRFLGYRSPASPDEIINAKIGQACDIVLSSITPRAVYDEFSLEELETVRLLEGNDIYTHLHGCDRAVLTAVTVGSGVEAKIRAAQATDALMPVILDACATAAVETLCDDFSKMLANTYARSNLYMTSRFSPGYGDFPIEKQHILLRLLDSERKIGLCATQSSILTPRKSVTAVIGVSPSFVKGKLAGCENCVLREKCDFKRCGFNPAGTK